LVGQRWTWLAKATEGPPDSALRSAAWRREITRQGGPLRKEACWSPFHATSPQSQESKRGTGAAGGIVDLHGSLIEIFGNGSRFSDLGHISFLKSGRMGRLARRTTDHSGHFFPPPPPQDANHASGQDERTAAGTCVGPGWRRIFRAFVSPVSMRMRPDSGRSSLQRSFGLGRMIYSGGPGLRIRRRGGWSRSRSS